MSIRNRIKEFRRGVPAREILANPLNWRRHPASQRGAMDAIFAEVGIAGVLTAYQSARHGGALTLTDGHLRQETDPDQTWDVVVLDITDDEADKLLATFDPIGGLAETDADALTRLVESIQTDSLVLRDLMWRSVTEAPAEKEAGEPGGAVDMDVQPFEQYDYVMVVYKDPVQFQEATALLGLGSRAYPQPPGATGKPKIGLCRVVDGATLNARLSRAPSAGGAAGAADQDGESDALSRLAQ